MVTDYFSSEVAALEGRIAELRRKQADLPDIFPNQQTSRIGYHSRPADSVSRRHPAVPLTRSIRLDLGSIQPVDSVVLVPADYAFSPDTPGAGYGFPVRWRVEVSDDGFEDQLRVLADHTGENFPNPRRSPVVIPAGGQPTRYVRLTATELWNFEGRAVLAMGEIMVLRGGRNVAAGLRSEDIKTTDSDESPPAWRQSNLVDGESVLGAPQGTIPSATAGFQSLPEKTPDNISWVMVDLGKEVPIHEIRLLPARSEEFPARRGFGFPLRYRVEIAPEADTTFSQPIVVSPNPNFNVRNPQENPVSIRVLGTPARFVKVTATRLSEPLDDCLFALSELQVFSDGENVAAGASVSARNSLETGEWSKSFLTDGFSSQRNLLPWPVYLAGLTERRTLDNAIRELLFERRTVRERVVRTTIQWCGAIIGIAVLVTALQIWRGRQARRRELSALRRRLAQDIHDEIGSGLGTIALLSHMGSANQEHPSIAREEFTEIQRISTTVTESLRDIVWFIRPETRTMGDLAQRLKETANSMLTGTPHEFIADCPALERQLPLEHKRQMLMFFKEALHNIIRHSGATRVDISVTGDQKAFRLVICDNGCGFDSTAPRAGAGLTGMKQRAKTLGGRLHIETGAGQGTRLILEVPWRSSRKSAARDR